MADTILVIDDQDNVRKLLKDYLTQQGFRVVQASDGQQGLFIARYEQPNLVLLDLMMPNMDGYQFLKAFRKESEIPVMILTARDEETDAVLGLESGADDYVLKPFRMRELTARIHAVLRRSDITAVNADSPKKIQVGDIQLDYRMHRVTVRGQDAALTPIEFDLLGTLMGSPDRVFTRSELVEALKDSGFAGLENTLNVHIRNLRVKIEKDPSAPSYLETIFGVGYCFRKGGLS